MSESAAKAPPLPVARLRPDELAVRMLFIRLARLQGAATHSEQARQVSQARHRVTSGLVALGWRVQEIAVAAGATVAQVTYWLRRGVQCAFSASGRGAR